MVEAIAKSIKKLAKKNSIMRLIDAVRAFELLMHS